MGVADMGRGNFDPDTARYDRMNRTKQPDFAPGQADPYSGDQAMNDIFSQSTVPNTGDQMSNAFSGMNQNFDMNMGMNINGMNMNMNGASANSMMQPTQPVSQDPADQFWAAMGKGFKSLGGFFSDLIQSFSQVTVLWWYRYFSIVLIASVVCGIVSIILKIFFSGSWLVTASVCFLSAGFSVVAMFIAGSKRENYKSLYKDGSNGKKQVQQSQPIQQQSQINNDFGGFNDFSDMSGGMSGDFNFDSNGFSDDPSPSFSDDMDSDDSDDDPYGLSGSDDTSWNVSVDDTPTVQEGMSTDAAFDSLQDIPKGMYERSYLYDAFLKVLPTMKPDFYTLKTIDEMSETFDLWADKLNEAASCAGCKEEAMPELTKLQENLFTIIVTCTRPQGCKPDAIAAELANIYAYNEDTGEKNDHVFAKADVIGASIKITIFNGTTQMISLKDMMIKEKDFILDTSNYIPVVLGVTQTGKVITADFKKIESIIITGMPRSGKSWFVQAVLTQMCVFVPPSELNVYICDPKEGISDFKSFVLPHVKKFVSGDNNIVTTLRDLVRREGPRRKKIIGDAGFVNIWDFKKRYPDVKLPIIYVVIDEVVTLASRMDKDTNSEFRMLLRELISQLPALGIRAFLIPHVLNNEIIEKKTSDLVPCKVSVCGDADHIEKATGSKFRDFPYKLVNKGDMAMKLTGYSNTLFVHGPALTDDNTKNSEVFDYLRRLWNKLEPEETPNSVAANIDTDKELSKIVDSVSVDDITGFGDDDV